ncbi:preprotein translocase subunit SecE [Desulfotalea psychrophila]|uniref:Protein translocase subunit SecE n=1 Tax=Desulfotalea psychrophila (strain LSv54 / DSM 12343) TaxID=177439 RepID=Q6AP84_DESPS|nr:preprotein translocase subunit SecE [Desulfotalea psychrophila]CAG35840.1 related to preprotein translocase secE subunit (partial length) [Desulfotalea psychrophila LSv54]
MAAKAKNKIKKSVNSKEKEDVKLSPAIVKQFFLDVKTEFFRIAWPDKKMTLGLAGIVVVLTGAISLYLGSVDFILGEIVSYVLG